MIAADPIDNNPVLIIGGGYLGTALYDSLLERHGRVFLSDRLEDRCSASWLRVNIVDNNGVKTLADGFRGREPRLVYVCVSTRGGDVECCRNTYLEGIANIIEYFSEARIVFCSSTALYGRTAGEWVDEDSGSVPVNEEAGVMLDAEQMVRRSGGIAARLSALYGPGRCVLLDRLRTEGRAIPGMPGRWLNYIHRDDAVSALARIGWFDGMDTLVNISDDCPLSLGEIYETLSNMLGLEMPDFIPPPVDGRRGKTNQRISNKRLRSYGWKASYPDFLAGIRSIITGRHDA